MSKPSDAAQRAKERTSVIDKAMADKADRMRELREQTQKLETECAGLAVEKATMFWVINGDKPEPPAMIGTATEPPSEGDAPRQKRKYTRKIGGLTAQSTHKEMTDTGATGDVPVVRAKAKEPEPDTGYWLCDNPNCHASFSAPIVSGKPGNTVESCPFCEETSIHMVRGPWQPTHECLKCGMRYVGQPKACVCKSKLGWKTLTT